MLWEVFLQRPFQVILSHWQNEYNLVVINSGDSATANKNDEKKVLNLMKKVVNTITSNVPGTSASHVAMRNEIQALMISIEKSLSSFLLQLIQLISIILSSNFLGELILILIIYCLNKYLTIGNSLY